MHQDKNKFLCFNCVSFPWLWISFRCLYLYNKSSFFIACTAKASLCFMIKSIQCFRLPSKFLDKSKKIVFGPVIITSLLPLITTPIIITTWLKCSKVLFLILLCSYKKYSICLILFFNLHELFPAFICANNTGSLVNSLFGVKILIPFISFVSSSLSSYGVSGTFSWLSSCDIYQ